MLLGRPVGDENQEKWRFPSRDQGYEHMGESEKGKERRQFCRFFPGGEEQTVGMAGGVVSEIDHQ
jgi:hypothetical protein